MRSASDACSGAGEQVLGSTEPRLWTPPLRPLTRETSYGFDLIDLAEVLGTPFDPWQMWLSVHAGELLPDGRPRFRTLLVCVARQNGKTMWARVLILYWLFVCKVPLVLATSTDRSYAKKLWESICGQVRADAWLSQELASVRRTISEEALVTVDGAEYTFAANNAAAGRSRTVHRALVDELREHRGMDCWNAVTNAMNAVGDGQVVAITNQGDDRAVALDALRNPALRFIETGEGDFRLGLFEWSAPAGSDPVDPLALAAANPNYGRRVDPDALRGAGLRAKLAGGEELAGFRTEAMCMRVELLDPAIDPDRWDACATNDLADLAAHRDRVALALDVALDGSHATLTAAAVVDGRVHVDVVAAWSGVGCTARLRRDLPGLVAKVRPRVLGWLPAGPAAVVTADMRERRTQGWPPRGVELVEIKTETPAVCMALADLVIADELRHAGDPMQDAHVKASQPLRRGDVWVFMRAGSGPIDGTYAAAAAAHLARTLPPPRPPLAAL